MSFWEVMSKKKKEFKIRCEEILEIAPFCSSQELSKKYNTCDINLFVNI